MRPADVHPQAGTDPRALHRPLLHEVRAEAAPKLTADDQRIAELKAEIDKAIVARDEPAAAAAHRELVDFEHELRVRETVRRCTPKQETID